MSDGIHNYHAAGLQDVLNGTVYKAAMDHAELVSRVAKDKLIAKYGAVPSDEDLRLHGQIIQTPDNWHHMVYRGETLIEWSGDLRFNEAECKLIRDYRF